MGARGPIVRASGGTAWTGSSVHGKPWSGLLRTDAPARRGFRTACRTAPSCDESDKRGGMGSGDGGRACGTVDSEPRIGPEEFRLGRSVAVPSSGCSWPAVVARDRPSSLSGHEPVPVLASRRSGRRRRPCTGVGAPSRRSRSPGIDASVVALSDAAWPARPPTATPARSYSPPRQRRPHRAGARRRSSTAGAGHRDPCRRHEAVRPGRRARRDTPIDPASRMLVRVREDDGWSDWTALGVSDDHGPDAGSLRRPAIRHSAPIRC